MTILIRTSLLVTYFNLIIMWVVVGEEGTLKSTCLELFLIFGSMNNPLLSPSPVTSVPLLENESKMKICSKKFTSVV